jgi:hypothetical protein
MRSKWAPPGLVLNREEFDRRAIRLGLTRRVCAAHGTRCTLAADGVPGHPQGELIVSNSAIAVHLDVAQSTISRARAGATVGPALIAAAVKKFGLPRSKLVRERVPA